jgi:SHS2 domain-containing protein
VATKKWFVSKGFRYLDHVTDALIEAYGSTLEEAFENSARGLVNTMFDLINISDSLEVKIEARGHDLYSLLYDWLEKVMLVILTENIILSDFRVKISSIEKIAGHCIYFLSCMARGEHIDLEKHHFKVEIKAVTYHEMQIKQEKENNTVTTRFLLDL